MSWAIYLFFDSFYLHGKGFARKADFAIGKEEGKQKGEKDRHEKPRCRGKIGIEAWGKDGGDAVFQTAFEAKIED